MEMIDLSANKRVEKAQVPSASELEVEKKVKKSPLEAYIEARDNPDANIKKLEAVVFKGGDSFANYMFGRNIPGANILKHIHLISADQTLDQAEKKIMLKELRTIRKANIRKYEQE